MIKTFVALLTLCPAGICVFQTSMAVGQSVPPQTKHYRLTFILNYPNEQQPSQTFVLDVPVTHDRLGMAGSATASGLTGEPESTVQQNLQCTDVQESATGLAAKVAFSIDSVARPLPGSTEPRHRNLTFNRQVDLALGKPTRITDELHVTPLGKGDEAFAITLPPAPQLTVTAIEM